MHDLEDAGAASALRIQLLGGFAVNLGDRPIDAAVWRRRKLRSLIAQLALAPGHALHREQILDALWPEHAPEAAANNLHQLLYLARRTLAPGAPGAHVLQLQDDMLRLAPGTAVSVDVAAFEAAVAAARRSQEPAAYRAALDLYAGDLLPEERFAPWADQRREALRHQYRAVLLELASLYSARGEHAAAIACVQQVVARDPTDEEATRALMRLYDASGQRPAAVRHYHLLRAALARELALEPDTPTEALHQSILTRRLDTAPSAPAAPTAAPARAAARPPLAPLTRLVGRAGDLVELRRLLASARLVTLAGTGALCCESGAVPCAG